MGTREARCYMESTDSKENGVAPEREGGGAVYVLLW